MKKASCFFATTMILFFGFQLSINAQISATWKGGSPGKSTDWDCASNWKEGRVPNEFSRVVIPDVSNSTFSNPVLANGEVEIWSLQIHSGASLRIGKNARLLVLEQEEYGSLALGEGFIRQGTYLDGLLIVSR